jgi:MFS superfamily sulfate permease-like transporter
MVEVRGMGLETIKSDLFPSFVVFLVALPLCLGISIASGVEPAQGLLSGIIGGIVVALFTGSPLQISGPSAGLAVMVLHVVNTHGPAALIPLGIIVGLFQVATALFKVAHFFEATPAPLIRGMLSGIGLLIVMSQFYIVFGLEMSSQSLQNLIGLPQVFRKILIGQLNSVQWQSGVVAFFSLLTLWLWPRGRGLVFRIVPGPLVSTLAAGFFVFFTGWEMPMVTLPDNLLWQSLQVDYTPAWAAASWSFVSYALGFAFIASAETLLCVGAVDKMSKARSEYNRTQFAQGVGNLVAGGFGALPVIGVISRSAANIEFGAKTRVASILQGLWLAGFLFIPQVLAYIPIPALAGLLWYIGLKLLDPKTLITELQSRSKSTVIFYTTFVLTITIDLLAGVVAGFTVALLPALLHKLR